jgi:Nif-specific regulatory protein
LNQQDIETPEFEISRTIIDKVRSEKSPGYYQNAMEDQRLKKSDSVRRLKILSVICLPLVHKSQLFGVVYLDHRRLKGVFKTEIFALVQEFANFISLAAFSALERKQLHNRVGELEAELRNKYEFGSIIGNHPRMVEILKLVSQVADTNATVLIQGESGTGKELIAHALHFNSCRRDKPFIPVNCAALPENLLESELFGHVRGAFTGAIKDKTGWFERADGGTIFLDEIGDMSPALQVKLLRVLQTGEYTKVGSTEIFHCDVRVIAATNKNLSELIKAGDFREDVYYRLAVMEIELPPLRERDSDILILAHHFLNKYNKICGRNVFGLTAKAESLLMNYDFPGNVRELENAIQRAVTLAESNKIEPHNLPPRISSAANSTHTIEIGLPLAETKRRAADKAEGAFILACLRQSNGHITNAAKIAGLDAGNFHRIMKKHGINPVKFKLP